MGKIAMLDEGIINKIAAGEVVERPSSVLKELIENALDAGTKSIEVEIESGGVRKIVVRDHGSGMEPEDARLAVRRHATSKITSVDDLFQVHSLGFRGEALASIAAVSEFSLQTAANESGQGLKLTTDGGEDFRESSWNGIRGTVVTVANLFHNVPARLKFLKTTATESSHCLEVMQHAALCSPGVGFILRHNGKELMRLAPVAVEHSSSSVANKMAKVAKPEASQDAEISLLPPPFGEQAIRQRTADLLGSDKAASLLYLCETSSHGRVEGLISPPGYEVASTKQLYTFVNNRAVKDRTIRYGILRGYHSHLLKGRYPVAVLHIQMDPALIDVNVHPAKTEVRFQYGGEVQNMIALAIRGKLRGAAWSSNYTEAKSADSSHVAPNHRGQAATVFSDFKTAFSDQTPSAKSSSAWAKSDLSSGQSTGVWPTSARGNAPTDGIGSLPGRPANSSYKPVSAGASVRVQGYAGLSDGLNSQGDSSFQDYNSHQSGQDPTCSTTGPGRSDYPTADLAVDRRARRGEGNRDRAIIPWDELQYLGSFAKCYLIFAAPLGIELETDSIEPNIDKLSNQERYYGRREGNDGGGSGAQGYKSVQQSSGEHLLVVDQHAFHERILFERLSNNPALLGNSQQLLVPEALVLAPTVVSNLADGLGDLKARGFDFAVLNETTIEVRSVPAILSNSDLETLFVDLTGIDASLKDDLEPADTNAELSRLILATIACHSAVRAGEHLSTDDLQMLLSEAGQVDFYHNCPHGRRVFKWWSRTEVARWFDR